MHDFGQVVLASKAGRMPAERSHHWGRASDVGKLTIIGSENGLAPSRRQATIWTSVGILLFGPLGTNFSEILVVIQTFLFKKMHLKMSSAKWRPLCHAWPQCAEHTRVRVFTFFVSVEQTHITNPTMHQTKCPTMYHLKHKYINTCTFLLQNSALWDMGLVHCGICELAQLFVIRYTLYGI